MYINQQLTAISVWLCKMKQNECQARSCCNSVKKQKGVTESIT